MNTIEKLESAKDAAWREFEKLRDSAWREYEKLRKPADAAFKKYQAAHKAHKEAVIYKKVKRQVMRDSINASGKERVLKDKIKKQKLLQRANKALIKHYKCAIMVTGRHGKHAIMKLK